MKRFNKLIAIVLIFSFLSLCPQLSAQEATEAPTSNTQPSSGQKIGGAVGGALGTAMGGAVGGMVGSDVGSYGSLIQGPRQPNANITVQPTANEPQSQETAGGGLLGIQSENVSSSSENTEATEGTNNQNQTQTPSGDDAGSGALSRYFENMSDKRRDQHLDAMIKNNQVPQGLGIGQALPNAFDLPTAQSGLEAEQQRINSQLSALGVGPIASTNLSHATDSKSEFLDTVKTHGSQFFESVGGNPDSSLFTSGLENGDIREGLRYQLNGAQLDALVAAQDSRQLLRGNQSGLHLEDIPMNQGLRSSLGLSGDSPQAFPQNDSSPNRFLMPGLFQQPQDRLSLIEQVDRAALVTADTREDYLLQVSRNIHNASLDEQGQTQLLASMDNTFMNRAAEAIDPFSYVLQQNKTDWIGPRAQLRTEQANNIADKIDGLTGEASTDSIYGRNREAMDKLRQTIRPLDYHKNFNDQYEQQHRDTEMRTGMTLATLPLNFLGGSGAITRGGSKILRGGRGLVSSAATRLRNLTPLATRTATRSATPASSVLRNSNILRQTAGNLSHTQTLTNIGCTTNNFSDDVFRAGQNVTVRRSSGALENSWKIRNVTSNGNIVVEQPGTNLIKQVRASDMVKHNPGLIGTGQSVTVQRSSGVVESGWKVLGTKGNRVKVTRNGLVKVIPSDDIVRLNHGTRANPPVRPANINGLGRNQSMNFNQNHRIGGGEKISDGFVDGGRGMQVGSNGNASSTREVLVVDRTRDANLQRHIDYAKSLSNLPEAQRAQRLAEYVDNVMTPAGGRQYSLNASNQVVNRYAGSEVLLGDVPNIGGGGVCRHRSLLYKVLGDEASLNTSLVRGNMATSHGVGGHAWNEVRLANGQNLVVDVMNPKPNFHLPSTSEVGSTYLTTGNKPMYLGN